MIVRPATESDAAAIADLYNRSSVAAGGAPEVDEDEIRHWFTLSALAMFVAERDGRVVGYADVRRDGEGTRFPIDLRLSPEVEQFDVADRLMAEAEDWSRALAREGALVRGFMSERETAAREALERRGYRPARHSFEMQIELSGNPEEPDWPEGIAPRTYDPDRDERRLYDCHQEAFSDHWDFQPFPLEEWRETKLAAPRFDPELWWLAEEGGELAGISLGAWHRSGDPAFGWIGDLAVRRAWRRRGLGLALLRQSFVDFSRRGATRVGLGVDAQNPTGAVGLYERAGMQVASRHDTYEREL